MFLAKYLPFFLLIGAALALKDNNDCKLKEGIDKCVKSEFLLEKDGKKILPKNVDEMNTWCDDVKKSEECAKDFIDKCTENDKEKKAMEHSLDGMIRVVKRVCKTDAKKNEFVQHEKCGNAIIDDGKKCVKEYKKHLIGASKLDDKDKDKITKILCCKVKDVPPCIEKAMKAKGDAVCNEKDIDYFKKMKEAMKEEMTAVLCGDFDTDTDAKCVGIDLAETKEDVDDKSLAEAMKKIMDKVL